MRLGFNQTDFAARAGVAKTSQFNYEKGDRSPDADYLASVAELGADVLYVVTGTRARVEMGDLAPEEVDVLRFLRLMPESDRQTFVRMAHAMFIASNPRDAN